MHIPMNLYPIKGSYELISYRNRLVLKMEADRLKRQLNRPVTGRTILESIARLNKSRIAHMN